MVASLVWCGREMNQCIYYQLCSRWTNRLACRLSRWTTSLLFDGYDFSSYYYYYYHAHHVSMGLSNSIEVIQSIHPLFKPLLIFLRRCAAHSTIWDILNIGNFDKFANHTRDIWVDRTKLELTFTQVNWYRSNYGFHLSLSLYTHRSISLRWSINHPNPQPD